MEKLGGKFSSLSFVGICAYSPSIRQRRGVTWSLIATGGQASPLAFTPWLKCIPPASSLGLEADPSAPGRVASEPQPYYNAEIDLAHERVEKEALIENAHHHNLLNLKSRLDTSLFDQLVFLIQDDPDAAEYTTSYFDLRSAFKPYFQVIPTRPLSSSISSVLRRLQRQSRRSEYFLNDKKTFVFFRISQVVLGSPNAPHTSSAI
ncbi:hypothetical protein VP01_1625g8 [Puccinia sorghi]|uniref:Uncharacterized protein n=1 Tax=Puccinia sorghi TaxID=27349 RepID=A0A0L6VH07_9BASI|nr:hypothetical protein VP01_1625g8 [Puccinia sorghi]